jgi:hypothetical protein
VRKRRTRRRPAEGAETRGDRARRQLRTFRLFLILPFAATAILLAPLALLKTSAEVEVTLKVGQLSFVPGELSGRGLLTSVRVGSLRLLGFREIDLGAGLLEIGIAADPLSDPPREWRRLASGPRVLLAPTTDLAAVTLRNVTLNQLAIANPPPLVMLASVEQEPSSLKLRIGGPATGEVTAGRVLTLICDYCHVAGTSNRDAPDSAWLRFTAERDHAVRFVGGSHATTLALELAPGNRFVDQNISLGRRVDFTRLEGGARVSTVLDDRGKIALPEFRREVPVGAGEFVILDGLKKSSIKALELDNGIRVVLHGRAGSLATGPAQLVRDRLPSLLEWLYARQTWTLYLNAVILIGTSALAILQRLQLVREPG